MSVLCRKEIERRLKLHLDDLESIVITPLLDEKFDHDSVDLRLGCYFRVPAVSTIECVKPYQHTVEHYPELAHKPYMRGGEISALILQPHHAVLASTLEYIKMPMDVSGQILTKSSWARIFISIASAPWIHPFYRGCLTLEVTNLGNVPVALPVGKPMAQLIFIKLEGPIKLEKDVIEGSYAGAVMPEAPIFKA
ncbi:MAG: dCTP deaminase [Phycisphaerae bacterium]|nr:dCTP deaminase [Phycisphaerae bacterium]